MDQYHFLVGELSNDSPFIPAAAGAQLFAWFAQIGEPVDRSGCRRGKIVRFSQRNYKKCCHRQLTPMTTHLSLHGYLQDEWDGWQDDFPDLVVVAA